MDLAIKEEASYKSPPSPRPEADDIEKAIYELRHNKKDIIDRVLRLNDQWHDLSLIAKSSPKVFIYNIWPWFIEVVSRIAYDPHPFVTGYQEDHSSGTNPERGELSEYQPITAIKDAIIGFASSDPNGFLTFYYENIDSPFIAVQRILSIGLIQIVAIKPEIIVEYLISDPRRLGVGDSYDQHKYSKRLISAVLPHLKPDKTALLEEAVMNWNRYYRVDPDLSPEERFKRTKWNRQHRLRLLRSFPDTLSSEKLNILKKTEERAFPNLPDWDSNLGGGGWVGSPMSQEQMAKADGENILQLFHELTDETEWDHPKRRWEFVGGSIQASREFAAFAQNNPKRAVETIFHFVPNKQERPAGMGIEGLSKSDLSSAELFDLVLKLTEKGFCSSEFKREVARGLGERAKKDEGLPDHIIDLLINWYSNETHPALEDIEKDDQEKEPQEDSIIWGYGGSFSLPGGRDVFVEAISLGYLLRKPPEYQKFSQFIEIMLQNERHPRIWQVTFHWMKFLYNWDKSLAASYYDNVIKLVPNITLSIVSIRAYAETYHMVPNIEMLYDWLRQISKIDKDFNRQAYGEMLVLHRFIYFDDEWGKEQLQRILSDQKYDIEQRGAAFAAASNWHVAKYQPLCTAIILTLSSTSEKITQKAISQIFRYGEIVSFSNDMKSILNSILNNDGILVQSAERLVEGIIDNTAVEPELVGKICSKIIQIGKEEIKNPGSRFSMVAEPIVSIALTLHRMAQPNREVGLNLFEQLIESNINHARQALDILDRKPFAANAPMRRRRRRRRKK